MLTESKGGVDGEPSVRVLPVGQFKPSVAGVIAPSVVIA